MEMFQKKSDSMVTGLFQMIYTQAADTYDAGFSCENYIGVYTPEYGVNSEMETRQSDIQVADFLDKLMDLLFRRGFRCFGDFRPSFDKLVKGLVECVVERPTVARSLMQDRKRPDYLAYHSINTAVYAVSGAHMLGYNSQELEQVARGALLHDAGMASIPTKIFSKSNPLTAEETFKIQQHPEIGASFVMQEEEQVRKIILSHHERYRGGGYPSGTSHRFCGTVASALVSAADAFDAMTSWRVYREARSLDEARLEVIRHGDSNWSQDVSNAFLKGLNRLGC